MYEWGKRMHHEKLNFIFLSIHLESLQHVKRGCRQGILGIELQSALLAPSFWAPL